MPEKYLDSLVILAVQFYDVRKVTFITEFLSILAYPQTFFRLFSALFSTIRRRAKRAHENECELGSNKE